MIKINKVLLVFATLLIFGLALGQPLSSASAPLQEKAKTQHSPDQQMTGHQSGVEQAPLSVNIKSLPGLTNEEVRAHKEEHDEKLTSDRWLLFLTAALAIATFMLWKTTASLARDTRKSGDIQVEKMRESIDQATRSAAALEDVAQATRDNVSRMQSSLHKQMRAYVVVNIGGATYQEGNLNFAAHPVIVNTGFTPARTLNYKVMAGIFEYPLPNGFLFPDVSDYQIYDTGMGPRQEFAIHGVVKDKFAESEAEIIMIGEKKRLFVWGAVTYNDIYDGGPWQTNFCHHYIFPKNKLGQVTPLGYFHTSGNGGT